MITTDDYLSFDINFTVEKLAKGLIELAPTATDRSFMKGAGIQPGYYGEAGVLSSLGSGAYAVNNTDYDIKFYGKALEVKTKTTTKKEPPPTFYECSLVDYIAGKQNCDYYVFTRVYKSKNKFEKGWILGYITPEEYMSKATFLKKGTLDPRNNYVVRNDCYNLEIKYLHPIKEILNNEKNNIS